MLRRMLSWALAVLALAFATVAVHAEQSVLIPSCFADKPVAGQITCDVRIGAKGPDRQIDYLSTPSTPDKITVRWLNGSPEDVLEFGKDQNKKFDVDKNSTAWLLLIDRSKSVKDKTLERIKEDLLRLVGRTRGKEQFGIAAFSDKVEFLAPFSDKRESREAAVKNLKLQGDKTAIYASLKTGLEYLNGVEADRKALVVVTDGREEDPRNSKQEVIEIAKALGIPIYVFGYVQEKKDVKDLSDLRDVAYETGGPYRFVDMTEAKTAALVDEKISPAFFSYMQNGGWIVFPEKGRELEISAKDMQGINLIRLTPKLAAAPTTPWKRFVGYFNGNETNAMIAAGVALAAFLGLVALALVMLLRSPTAEVGPVAGAVALSPMAPTVASMVGSDMPKLTTPTAEPQARLSASRSTAMADTMILGNGGNPGAGGQAGAYAWLERIDGSKGQRIPIQETTVRIGRHEDNDIRLDLASVHRRHAVLHLTPKREFIITDLSGDGGNGVKVNSIRIKAPAQVKPSDVIEIGEVKLKFHIASV